MSADGRTETTNQEAYVQEIERRRQSGELETTVPPLTTDRSALMCGYCGYVTRAQDCPRCGTGLWRRRMNKPADDDNWQLDVIGDEWGMY